MEFQYVSYEFKPDGQPSQSDNSVDLKGVYYINPKVGIGAEIAKQNGDSNFFQGTLYSFGVDAFVTENISLTAQYTGFSADNSAGSDSDEWKISAAWWF